MALIVTRQHSRRDIDRWSLVEREAAIVATSATHARRVVQARAAVEAFAAGGVGYVGVSWGKDSVVVADLVRGLGLPLVWVRVEPIVNPDCARVRDLFFGTSPSLRASYEEIEVWCRRGESAWHARGTLEAGFKQAAGRHGKAHVSGVRGEESSIRKLTVRRNGLLSATTCRPIARWSGMDVFAYLLANGLPIHPAYGYTMDGLLDPTRLRVASLGGKRGDGMGRRDWEMRYYGEALKAAERMLTCP